MDPKTGVFVTEVRDGGDGKVSFQYPSKRQPRLIHVRAVMKVKILEQTLSQQLHLWKRNNPQHLQAQQVKINNQLRSQLLLMPLQMV